MVVVRARPEQAEADESAPHLQHRAARDEPPARRGRVRLIHLWSSSSSGVVIKERRPVDPAVETLPERRVPHIVPPGITRRQAVRPVGWYRFQ
ncbi:hypothetical protein CUD01_28610 [Cellulomonas uda]|uniref:Uncharacterized protein n=1 Tax=Cellulomonas uda TaxID=1714 RepID=A0A4Y3KEH9_CELUD|nr:hypothetical protein CUD01_28610 [Cellulomonas uda]